ncbi:MAG: DUF3131 domain-containing protein [Ramlibacter sp.]
MLNRRVVLAGSAGALLAGCGAVARGTGAAAGAAKSPVAGLDAQEFQWARTAWRYLENNTDYDTGLVNGMDRVPTLTAWNAADAIAATIAGHELQVIEAHEFDLRLSRLLGFLATMELSQGQLPNKAYNTLTGRMVGFDNRPGDIGWSAVDVGRLLLWLRIAGQRHPRLREYADKVVLRWTFCNAIDECGALYGTARSNGQVVRYQEGRLGYEQLAAAGYAAWGFEVRQSSALPAVETANVDGVPVRFDARDPRTTGAQAPVLTMPYVLSGIELGWVAPDGSSALREPAQQVYRAQEQRWRRERQVTARTDYQLREAPWVVLDSVYASGYAWNTVGTDGQEHERLAQVSTRAAFGLWALWPGEYADALVENVRFLFDPDRGWFEGRFEQGGGPNTTLTLGTNAAILETLLFKAKGALYAHGQERPGLFQVQTADAFNRVGRCWPGERAACERSRPAGGSVHGAQ